MAFKGGGVVLGGFTRVPVNSLALIGDPEKGVERADNDIVPRKILDRVELRYPNPPKN